ncbi:MAG: SprT-like domain-containing protein [Flavobacteriales bacterium]|nr:SprT-like domain-containing protein [Bacteroidota bacterium]MCB9240821.1 SprT-like domain-containing protein [Flavobacteriales bacterium]
MALRIKKPRATKLGDYRHPHGHQGHRISINSNLNPFAFFVTLVHELAHLVTWNEHRNRTAPHGAEWKRNFQLLLAPFIREEVLPDDIHRALEKTLKSPGASSCNDLNLSRALSRYDQQKEVVLEHLPSGSIFQLKNGKRFRKGNQLRKRFKCLCLDDNRWYYVHPLVPVEAEIESTKSL